ncbi:MAG: methylenetetrahydrofolate reductase [NAD(P)H] [Alphaproteobacteria bacterium]|nr:methylenetetrahydrofolate reductase [NAD(P)H] [Alphaproteobacteria bacterium]
MSANRKMTYSFEYFPPKTDKAAEMLWSAFPELVALNPKYMTVTYGAGGTTRDGTIQTIEKMMRQTDIPIGSHLTYINTTKQALYEYVDGLWDKGIKHIIALRGDMPSDLEWPLDKDGEYFQYTSDFVEGLVDRHPFEISVGAYPEKHPDANSLDQDIQALKLKCEAGSTRAITQFFFDNKVYYDFVERCRKAGITTPICPGLLPVHDFTKMLSFAERCQAGVPQWMHEKFAGLEDKPEEAKKIAIELLVKQSLDLKANGVDHIHYYTLNKSDITKEACEAIS